MMPRSQRPKITADSVGALQEQVIDCACCPRLVRWRERVARDKVRRFRDQEYWGRPVPSFGDPQARLFILGLAPAAHGGNRTGRVFTGDRSGDWLYGALHRTGFANQPTSVQCGDGLALRDAYISAVIHCAPPANQPQPDEVRKCRPYLLRELELLQNIRVVLALGRIAFDAAHAALETSSRVILARRPSFGHGAEYELRDDLTLMASFHPSQQNTFTGRLTEPMFMSVFERARALLGPSPVGDSNR